MGIQTVTTVKVTDDITGKTETREFDSIATAEKSVTEFKMTVNGKAHKFIVTAETAKTLADSLAVLANDSASDSDRNDARRDLGSLFPRNLIGSKGSKKSGDSDSAGMTRSAWLQANSDYKGVGVVSKENQAKWDAHIAAETASPNGDSAK
jgi:hypothetical protein